MNHKTARSVLALALIASLTPLASRAQLQITEVESSEASGVLPTADWWELSNLGLNAVDLTGYKMDDSSASFASSVPLAGVTSIAAGESVVFFEQSGSGTPTVQDFRDWWGSGLSLSVQVGTYSGSGVGLSSSGDAVTLFDSSGTVVDSVTFGAATAGTSFVFGDGAAGRSPAGLSQDGVNGAFTSQNGDIGSPGAVPEPSSIALIGVSLGCCLGFCRKRVQNG